MDDRNTRGEALRRYIKSRGLTQREAAQKIGISAPHLANLLNARDSMGHLIVTKICEAFPDISAAYLLTGEGMLVPPGGIRIQQHGNNNSGDGAGAIHLGTDAALRAEVAQLRDQLQREREEKERLLGIIETITGK